MPSRGSTRGKGGRLPEDRKLQRGEIPARSCVLLQGCPAPLRLCLGLLVQTRARTDVALHRKSAAPGLTPQAVLLVDESCWSTFTCSFERQGFFFGHLQLLIVLKSLSSKSFFSFVLALKMIWMHSSSTVEALCPRAPW